MVTAYRAIHADCYADGGLFVPFRLERMDKEQLAASLAGPTSQVIANILNQFFGCGLTMADVDFTIGRAPIKTKTNGRNLVTLELWHNTGGDCVHLARRLSDRLRTTGKGEMPSNWMQIAVRIALLFAGYSTLVASQDVRLYSMIDVAVTAGDFAMPMAALYARQMGLPIGCIVCGCNDNGGFWDLLNRGEFATGDTLTVTNTPEADVVVPRNLERLIHTYFGVEENKRYLQCCSKGEVYALPAESAQNISKDFFAAVISDSRVSSIIPGVYQTRGYVLSPYSALAYGSLQDYRSMTGQIRPTMLVAERSPLRDALQVSRHLQMKENELYQLVER